MRKRIFIYFTIAIIFTAVLGLFAVAVQIRRFYRKDIEGTLKSITYAIDRQLAPVSAPDFPYLSKYYSGLFSDDNLKIRITFIDLDGNIKGESDHSPESMDNHLTRKEVADAVKNGFGSSIRYSDTAGSDLMYAALRSELNLMVIRAAVPVRNISETSAALVNFTFYSALAALAISLAAAFLLSRIITRPVRSLVDASLDIYNGDLDRRVTLKNAAPEMETLAAVFNDMTGKLRDMIRELGEKNIRITSIIDSMADGLLVVDDKRQVMLINRKMKQFFDLDTGSDYTGRNVLDVVRNRNINEIITRSIEKSMYFTEEMKVPAEKGMTVYRIYTAPVSSGELSVPGTIVFMQDVSDIRKLEQMRSDFVSNVSHELRTPLTSIKGFIETLKGGAIDDREKSIEFLNIIEMESERLSALISDILSLSEIEHGPSTVMMSVHDLRSVTENVFSILSTKAAEKGIRLINGIDEGSSVHTDSSKLVRLLVALVENGVKYNRSGGFVKVSMSRQKGLVEISVEDNGYGITEEHLPRIFERFYRVEKGRPKDGDSTGLGLAIAKHLARMLNGDIRVRSTPGKGSVFILSIPSVNL